LVVNPTYDAPFAGLAHELVAGGATDAADLELALRSTYPAVVVRARALSGERAVVLYVYRDGRWVNGAARE